MNTTSMQRLLVVGVVLAGLGMGTISGLVVRRYRQHPDNVAHVDQTPATPATGDIPAAQKDTPEVEILAEATFLVEEGRHADAVRVLDRYTQVYPANPHGFLWFGHALRGTGALREAMEAYDRALVLDTEFTDARLARAETCLLRGESFWNAGNRESALLHFSMARSAARRMRGDESHLIDAARILAQAVEGMSREASEAVMDRTRAKSMPETARRDLDTLLEEGIYAARTAAAGRLEDAGARTLAAALLLRRAHFYEAWEREADAMNALSESLHAYRSALQLAPSDPDVRQQAQSAEHLLHTWVEKGVTSE